MVKRLLIPPFAFLMLLACAGLPPNEVVVTSVPTEAEAEVAQQIGDNTDKGTENDSEPPVASPEPGLPSTGAVGLDPSSLQAAASLENATVTGVFDVEMLGTSAYVNSLDRLVFIGAFRNAGIEAYGNWSVTISLYDDAGNLLVEDRGFPDFSELEVGEFTSFSVFFEEGVSYEGFSSFEVQPFADEPNPFINRSRELTLTDVAGGSGDFVDYELTGIVTNNSADTLEFVKISAAFFDANGNLVAAEFGFSDLDELAPGQSSPFDILVFTPLGEIADFELNVQGSVVE